MASQNRRSSLSILHRARTAGWAKHKRCNINAALFNTPTLGSHPDQLSPAGRTSHPSKGTTASQNHPSLRCPPLHRVRKPRKSTLLAPSSCSLVEMRLPGLLNHTEESWLRSWQQNYRGVSEHLVNQRFTPEFAGLQELGELFSITPTSFLSRRWATAQMRPGAIKGLAIAYTQPQAPCASTSPGYRR